jgi:DNA-binding NarL/FixJ family response regulator
VQVVAESDSFENINALVTNHQPDVILFGTSIKNENLADILAKILLEFPFSKILVLSDSFDELMAIDYIFFGIAGVFSTNLLPELLIKAIQVVNKGDLWFDRKITKRIFQNHLNHHIASIRQENNTKSNQPILTPQECHVACLASKGLNAKSIGKELFISEKTVRKKLTIIYQKLQVKGHVELCLKADKFTFCRLPDFSRNREICPIKK